LTGLAAGFAQMEAIAATLAHDGQIATMQAIEL
jgi:hypothetical protein